MMIMVLVFIMICILVLEDGVDLEALLPKQAVRVVRRAGRAHGLRLRVVALQVAFERRTLKPAFQLMGYRLWV